MWDADEEQHARMDFTQERVTCINCRLHKTCMMYRIVYTKLSSSLLLQLSGYTYWKYSCVYTPRIGSIFISSKTYTSNPVYVDDRTHNRI